MTVRSYFRQLRAEDFNDKRLGIQWYTRTGSWALPFRCVGLYTFGDYDRVVEYLTYEPKLSSLEVDERVPYSPLVRSYKLPSAAILR